tara:strand:+ start:219 stop:1004 length:786 start_codon:yes stop_codon:yes gene_type:complete
MSAAGDIPSEDEPSEEELMKLSYQIYHYINVMQGPQYQAVFELGPFAEFQDPFEDPNELGEHMLSKYSEWTYFLTPDGEDIDFQLFLQEDIQELVFDESVNTVLSTAPDIPKVSLMGQRPIKNCNMYLAPNIPTKKLNNGISNERFRVNGMFKETDVLALLDEKTVIFAPKNGLMITNIGIFWRGTWQYGGLPWRIGDSSMTAVIIMDGPMGTKFLAVVIDDEFILPIGGLGLVYESEMEYIGTLMSAMIGIAHEQYNSSR